MDNPIICFGQQPCGFFPKRFLVAKINTARRLQKELASPEQGRGSGKIVFFYHDSDADYRETITVMVDRQTGAEVRLNFLQPNKVQKNFSPLYLKKIASGWKDGILKQLPRFVGPNLIELFKSVQSLTVADFCLEIYQKLGLLDGFEIVRSSDRIFRQQAEELSNEFFADLPYHNETVRAKKTPFGFQLHSGGGKFIDLPKQKVEKWQKSAARDQRLEWMQSVIHCTHYIYGEGEAEYLKFDDLPNINFIQREEIDHPNLAWIPNS